MWRLSELISQLYFYHDVSYLILDLFVEDLIKCLFIPWLESFQNYSLGFTLKLACYPGISVIKKWGQHLYVKSLILTFPLSTPLLQEQLHVHDCSLFEGMNTFSNHWPWGLPYSKSLSWSFICGFYFTFCPQYFRIDCPIIIH